MEVRNGDSWSDKPGWQVWLRFARVPLRARCADVPAIGKLALPVATRAGRSAGASMSRLGVRVDG